MSLNKLPNGKDSPRYLVTAIKDYDGEEATLELQEWWYAGKKVEDIEVSAKNRFYDYFDKHSFEITNIEMIKGS